MKSRYWAKASVKPLLILALAAIWLYALINLFGIFFFMLCFVIFFWFINLEFIFNLGLRFRNARFFNRRNPFPFSPAGARLVQGPSLSGKDFFAEILWLAHKGFLSFTPVKARLARPHATQDISFSLSRSALDYHFEGLTASQTFLLEWLKRFSKKGKFRFSSLGRQVTVDDGFKPRFMEWSESARKENLPHAFSLDPKFIFLVGVSLFAFVAVFFIAYNAFAFPDAVYSALLAAALAFSEAFVLWLAFPYLVPSKNFAQLSWMKEFELFRAFMLEPTIEDASLWPPYLAFSFALDAEAEAWHALSLDARKEKVFGGAAASMAVQDFLRLADNFAAELDYALAKPAPTKLKK